MSKESNNENLLDPEEKKWLLSLLPELRDELKRFSQILVLRGQTRAIPPFEMSVFEVRDLKDHKFTDRNIDELTQLLELNLDIHLPVENDRIILSKSVLDKVRDTYNFLEKLTPSGYKRNLVFSDEKGLYDPQDQTQQYKFQKTRKGEVTGSFGLIKHLIEHKEADFPKVSTILGTDVGTDISNSIKDINTRFTKNFHEEADLIIRQDTGGYRFNSKFTVRPEVE